MYQNRRIKGVFGLASVAGEWENPGATPRSVMSKITLLVRKFLLTCKRTAYRTPSYVWVSLGIKL